MCVNMNGLFPSHRHHVGQGGVSLCRGSWAGSGLRAARAASHGSHHRGLPRRVCPQDLGDMAEKERRLGKKCCLIGLVSACPDQKISQLMKVRVCSLQIYAEKDCVRFTLTMLWPHLSYLHLTPVLDLFNSVAALWSHPQNHQLFLSQLPA